MDGTAIVLLHVLHVISSQSDVVPRNCMYLKILDIENRMRQKKKSIRSQFIWPPNFHDTAASMTAAKNEQLIFRW